MATETKYVPTDREKAFQGTIENPKYDRDIINGLTPFFKNKAHEDFRSFYSAGELEELAALKGTDRDVEARMPVKLTRHFFELAKHSEPLRRIVKASPDETLNLAGSEDPGYQMDFAPVEGLLHKYEMGLLYVVSTCSAHCRFCYREELISQKEIERQDGTVAKKGLAQIKEVTDYIKAHNEIVAANGGRHPETGREKLREILEVAAIERFDSSSIIDDAITREIQENGILRHGSDPLCIDHVFRHIGQRNVESYKVRLCQQVVDTHCLLDA